MTRSAKPLFAVQPRHFAQERARRTYEALLIAAADVFAERGFDATQTPDIAGRAEVSVGTFYRYFSDKREAFLEVVRQHLSEAHQSVMAELVPERFVGAGRRQTIETALAILLEHVGWRPGLQRVFLEMSLRDDQMGALRRTFDDEARKTIAALIRAICPPEDVPDPDATAFVVQTAAVECAIAIGGARGELPIGRDRAMRALGELVFRAFFGIERS
jgi:AcrR family transcriptional regulator